MKTEKRERVRGIVIHEGSGRVVHQTRWYATATAAHIAAENLRDRKTSGLPRFCVNIEYDPDPAWLVHADACRRARRIRNGERA